MSAAAVSSSGPDHATSMDALRASLDDIAKRAVQPEFTRKLLGEMANACAPILNNDAPCSESKPLFLSTGDRRRIGRSEGIANFAGSLLRFAASDKQILIFTDTDNTAKHILYLALVYIGGLDGYKDVKEAGNTLMLTGNRRLTVLTSDDSIRGLSCDLLIVDGAPFFSLDTLFLKIVPLLSVSTCIGIFVMHHAPETHKDIAKVLTSFCERRCIVEDIPDIQEEIKNAANTEINFVDIPE